MGWMIDLAKLFLFPAKPAPKVHIIDAHFGDPVLQLECSRCGGQEGWAVDLFALETVGVTFIERIIGCFECDEVSE